VRGAAGAIGVTNDRRPKTLLENLRQQFDVFGVVVKNRNNPEKWTDREPTGIHSIDGSLQLHSSAAFMVDGRKG
jgi:hypothetical protein